MGIYRQIPDDALGMHLPSEGKSRLDLRRLQFTWVFFKAFAQSREIQS